MNGPAGKQELAISLSNCKHPWFCQKYIFFQLIESKYIFIIYNRPHLQKSQTNV